jgi:hypothetical protein
VLLLLTMFCRSSLASPDSCHESQATRNGIRVGDLRDFEVFADKLRKLALDGARRFEGFEYDVEADIEAYLRIIPRVLPLITDTVCAARRGNRGLPLSPWYLMLEKSCQCAGTDSQALVGETIPLLLATSSPARS